MNGREYLALVGSLPCVLCARLGMIQKARTECHHLRDGQGMQQRAQDWLAIAACTHCHTGAGGIHGDRTLLRVAKVDEVDLLADTVRAVMNRGVDHA